VASAPKGAKMIGAEGWSMRVRLDGVVEADR
jgi:hypothetical protein